MTDSRLHEFWTAWLQQNLPCVRDYISLVVQLLFAGIVLLRFLGNIAGRVCHRNTKLTDHQGTEKYSNNGVKFSTITKCCVVCSLSLIVVHGIKLLILLNGGRTYCNNKFQIYSSETMQMVSWAASAAAIYTTLSRKSIKYPCLLRAWWLCSFIMSIIGLALDTHLRTTSHGNVTVQDYVEFLSLIPSIFLFGYSFGGKTGIVMNDGTDEVTDPLLNGTDKKHLENTRESLYAQSTLLQLVTFSWLNPLFVIGFKKPLDQDEIPDINIKDSAAFCSHSFEECLKHVKERDGAPSPSIYKTIYMFIRSKAAINAAFAVTYAAASYVGPYLIDDFVSFLTHKKTQSLQSGYLLALGFLGAKMVETIAQRQWIFGARQLGLRLRAALISQIYKKGLVLSSQSRQSRTSGEVINYMGVDIQRITDFLWYVNMIWMLPIQISLAICILHRDLSYGSLAALAATSIVMAFNIPLTRIQKKFQSMIMEAKDNRMKATSEVLRNMKTLKLQGWDIQFLHNLEALRKLEYNWLWKSLKLAAISAFIFWGAPTFISVVTFGACLLMRIELTAGRVLSALATFRMLQEPIFNLPDLLNVIAQAKVSADRVSSYLQEDEIQQNAIEYVPKNETDLDIEIENGKFSWDPESSTSTLDNINLEVKRGMKVAICGTVGSGKSSLLSSILGELQKISGTVKISGTKAYVPQSPWILSGNIRDNILFGNHYDSVKYDRTIKACALVKDFELFSHGDLTEIGERGINMSGGQKQRIQIARAVYQDADIYILDDPFSAVDAHTGTQLFEVLKI